MLDEQIISIFPKQIKAALRKAAIDQKQLEEIRVRVNQPLIFMDGEREYYIDADGRLSFKLDSAIRVTKKEIDEMLSLLCQYSVYAYEDQLRMGYIILIGGHRVGVVGENMTGSGGSFRMSNVAYLNIRIARQRIGCALQLMKALQGNDGLHNTVIIAPPGVGKTTYLRDLIRCLSTGNEESSGMKVGVVDERGELAAKYQGIPQNDLGPRTDVLSYASKSEGIYLLLRSMSPQVIAVDELGLPEDYEAVGRAFHCGCKLILTMHGSRIEELMLNTGFLQLKRKGMLDRFVFLEKDAKGKRRASIYNERLERIAVC